LAFVQNGTTVHACNCPGKQNILIYFTYAFSVILKRLARKSISEMIYFVSSGMREFWGFNNNANIGLRPIEVD